MANRMFERWLAAIRANLKFSSKSEVKPDTDWRRCFRGGGCQ